MIDKEKYKKKNITIGIDEEGQQDEMSYYELSRWMSLMEAVDVVDKKAEQLRMPKSDNSWIKPIALSKYVDERTDSMLFEITNEDTL